MAIPSFPDVWIFSDGLSLKCNPYIHHFSPSDNQMLGMPSTIPHFGHWSTSSQRNQDLGLWCTANTIENRGWVYHPARCNRRSSAILGRGKRHSEQIKSLMHSWGYRVFNIFRKGSLSRFVMSEQRLVRFSISSYISQWHLYRVGRRFVWSNWYIGVITVEPHSNR